jgi:lycopene cyclase domain-containing protein
MILTGMFFIAWDRYFTQLKIWGFNAAYLTGVRLVNLPLEEVLFFFCIPYSCIFTYSCIKALIKKRISKLPGQIISTILIGISIFMAIRFNAHFYTVYTFTVLAILLFIAQYILKVKWLSVFYISYLLLLLPFVIVNGLLTGTGLDAPVVWYNPEHIINLRILTIPVEDIFYGMDLILLNIMIFSLLSARGCQTRKNNRRATTRSTSSYNAITNINS